MKGPPCKRGDTPLSSTTETLVTITVQTTVVARTENSYQKKLDRIVRKLEKEFGCVSVESEEELRSETED